jgi:hypothetical protein
MSTITTLNAADTGAVSRGVINTNFTNLNTDKAELASPTFTGTPTLPTGTIAVTQSANDNSTKVATTAYVDSAAVAFTSANFATTQVFSGAGPGASFTDLNLSSVVGATQRVVLLKVTCGTAGGFVFTFKRKGDTATHGVQASTGGVNQTAGVQNGESAYVLTATDTSGVVQWATYSGTPTTTINVEAYW